MLLILGKLTVFQKYSKTNHLHFLPLKIINLRNLVQQLKNQIV